MFNKKIIFLVIFLTVFLMAALYQKADNLSYIANVLTVDLSKNATSTKNNVLISDNFDKSYKLEEVYPMNKSKSDIWWVSSGAYLISKDGVGKTISGNLTSPDPWIKKFKKSNPTDTSNGLRPQNIFRLVTKKELLNFEQEVYIKITHFDFSESEYRNQSNGVLLFNRYQDENNLYYAGIRVDGQVVIKKKINGLYYTLGIVELFGNYLEYDRVTNPTLIPLNKWLGIKSVVRNIENNKVQIDLLIDKDNNKNWEKVISVVDDGMKNEKAITNKGHGGIRTDFADVEFDNYFFKEIQAQSIIN